MRSARAWRPSQAADCDVFPITALTPVLQLKLGKPSLSAPDWIKIGSAGGYE